MPTVSEKILSIGWQRKQMQIIDSCIKAAEVKCKIDLIYQRHPGIEMTDSYCIGHQRAQLESLHGFMVKLKDNCLAVT